MNTVNFKGKVQGFEECLLFVIITLGYLYTYRLQI